MVPCACAAIGSATVASNIIGTRNFLYIGRSISCVVVARRVDTMSVRERGSRRTLTVRSRGSRLVVLVRVQEPGDLATQDRHVGQIAHRTRVVEELALQLLRHGIPAHDQCGAETTQDALLVLPQASSCLRPRTSFRGTVLVVVVGNPSLVVGERCAAAALHVEYARAGIRTIRFGCDHGWLFLLKGRTLGDQTSMWRQSSRLTRARTQ